MNTVLMYVIMGLVCRFKAPGGDFRNLKFDLLYKYIYIYSQGLQIQEPQITDRLGISPKLIHLTSYFWQKNLVSERTVFLDFDPFESAD